MRIHTSVRSVLLALCVLMACSRFDTQKFEGAYRAGKALEIHVDSTGGANTAEASKLLQHFQTEVSVLEGRANGERELSAVQAFKESADAYIAFLRFRELDMRDAVDGRILLMGTNLDIAKKYSFPVEKRDDTDWVESASALRLLLPVAKSRLSEANKIVNEQ